jgi:hypothetical protein
MYLDAPVYIYGASRGQKCVSYRGVNTAGGGGGDGMPNQAARAQENTPTAQGKAQQQGAAPSKMSVPP